MNQQLDSIFAVDHGEVGGGVVGHEDEEGCAVFDRLAQCWLDDANVVQAEEKVVALALGNGGLL